MAFDPDKYLNKLDESIPEEISETTEKKAFDPDSYLSSDIETQSIPKLMSESEEPIEEIKPLPQVSQARAAQLGVGQGLTFGFGEELGGLQQQAMETGQRGARSLQDLYNEYIAAKTGLPQADIVPEPQTMVSERLASEGFTGDLGPTSPEELYESSVAQERAEIAAAEEQHPWTIGAADVAAGFAIPIPGAGAARATVKGVPKAAKALQGLSKTKKGLAAGAGVGALEGAGRTEEDLTSLEGLTDIAMGAGIGGGLGAIGGKIAQRQESKELTKRADELLEEADIQAQKALGAGKKQMKETLESTYKYGKPKKTGIMALEEDLVDPLSRPQETYQKVLNKRQEIQKGYEEAIGKFENQINLSENQALDLSQKYFDRIKNKVSDAVSGNDQIPPEMKQRLGDEVAELQEEILTALDSSNPIKELQDLYVRYNDVFFKNIKSPTSQARRAMRNEIKNIQRELADVVDPGTKKQFQNLDEKYTSILDLEKMSLDRAAKFPEIGVGDVVKGITARMTGIPGAGEVVTGASVLSKKVLGQDLTDVIAGRAAQSKYKKAQKLQSLAEEPGMFERAVVDRPEELAAGLTAGTTSLTDAIMEEAPVKEPYQMHQRAAKIIEQSAPETLKQQAEVVRNQYGEEGQRLATILENMAEKDKSGRRALMFHILQNPRYKKMLMPSEEEVK